MEDATGKASYGRRDRSVTQTCAAQANVSGKLPTVVGINPNHLHQAAFSSPRSTLHHVDIIAARSFLSNRVSIHLEKPSQTSSSVLINPASPAPPSTKSIANPANPTTPPETRSNYLPNYLLSSQILPIMTQSMSPKAQPPSNGSGLTQERLPIPTGAPMPP
jgi:hypothetical protein